MSDAPPKKPIPRPPRGSTEGHAQRKDASLKVALLAAQAGLEKKASGVEIIDVVGKVDYADYLVLMTGQSDRNVSAIAQEVDAALSRSGNPPMSVEGMSEAKWVLLDFVDVVVHVFQRDARSLYDLDGLWLDADRVPVADAAEPA